MRYEPPQFHATHTHRCAEPGCKGRVGCAAPRCRRCEDAHCVIECDEVELVCEDHR